MERTVRNMGLVFSRGAIVVGALCLVAAWLDLDNASAENIPAYLLGIIVPALLGAALIVIGVIGNRKASEEARLDKIISDGIRNADENNIL